MELQECVSGGLRDDESRAVVDVDDPGTVFHLEGMMTVLEHIESLDDLRSKARQAIARYSIEIQAMQDYMRPDSPNLSGQYHHAWDRGVYAAAWMLAQDLRKLELVLSELESERESQP